MKEYAGKKQKDYTAESWKQFSDAFEHAKAVLAKENPTQAEVNQALRNLETAAGTLVKVDDTPETPRGGSQGSSSGNTSNGSTSNGNPSNGSQITGTNAPTGDHAQPALYMGLLMTAAVAAVVVYGRKNREDNESLNIISGL